MSLRSTRRVRLPIALLMTGSACGCLVSIDDSLVDRDASLPSETAADGGFADGGVPPEASGDGGPGDASCSSGMVLVPSIDSGAPYCVDSTEVTNAAYAAFLSVAEPPAAGSQIAACSFNTTFVPSGWAGVSDQRPVGGLDWCDAYAFCQSAGKHLCGALGGGSFSYALGTAGDLATSEWFNACSASGALAYPYGSAYEPQACDGADYDAGFEPKPIPVGEATGCQGGFAGLFDMSGNVAEFLDSCSSSPDPECDGGGPACDLCMLVGGSSYDHGADLACSYVNVVWRGAQYVDNGFRCCQGAR